MCIRDRYWIIVFVPTLNYYRQLTSIKATTFHEWGTTKMNMYLSVKLHKFVCKHQRYILLLCSRIHRHIKLNMKNSSSWSGKWHIILVHLDTFIMHRWKLYTLIVDSKRVCGYYFKEYVVNIFKKYPTGKRIHSNWSEFRQWFKVFYITWY